MTTVKDLKELLQNVDDSKEINAISFFGGQKYSIVKSLYEKDGKLYIKII